MASRPAFLSGARGSPVKKPDPKRPERKPPTRREPDRRKPGRKTPDRPRRRQPDPRKRPPPDRKPRTLPDDERTPRRKPLFRPEPKPKVPFGKYPVPQLPKPALRRWLTKRLLKFAAAGLIPGIGLALSLWELYDLYQWLMEQRQAGMYPPSQTRYTCANDNPAWTRRMSFWYGSGDLLVCESFWYPPGAPEEGQENNWDQHGRWWVRWENRPEQDPFNWWWISSDYYPADPGMDPEWHPTPWGDPLPLIPDLPYPYPLSWEPLPWTPPLDKPEPEPRPEPDYPRKWDPEEPEMPTDRDVPSIDLTPGDELKPDVHEKRPPEPPEREKKKRLGKSKSDRWLWVLDNIIGNFTETDDVVSAVYKGLPWKYRRWKGRDGVWRDRDANTASRLQRLYKLIGKLDVDVAVDEIIKNEMSDKAFGKVGNRLKKKTRELADEGLWGSFQGLARNPNRFNKSWEDVYKKLKSDAAKREREKGHNWFYSKQYDQKTNRWVGVWKQRPMTQIPWYRVRSNFDRTRHLTGQKTGYKTKVPRYFYSPRDTYGDNADYLLNKWDE